jgi:ubiquinone/menaquinone biosynthesis C-methylase UbiE
MSPDENSFDKKLMKSEQDHKSEDQTFDESYFKTNTYEHVSFSPFSQYWWSNRFYAILARRYGIPGSRLLEIGCGLGHLVVQLEDTFETYAIDVNEWALGEASKIAARTHLELASAEELPFSDKSFGVVIIKHVVEHLSQPERAVREIGRILMQRGVLIFSTPNLDSMLKPLKGDRWIGFQDPTHISLKRPIEWLELIRSEAYLHVLRIFSDGFWDVPYLPIIPSSIQKLVFGSLGGFQAVLGRPFLPPRWGESILVIARKP